MIPWTADVERQLAELLAHHYQVRLGKGECGCGAVVPLGGFFTQHQVRVLLAALAEYAARIERGDQS